MSSYYFWFSKVQNFITTSSAGDAQRRLLERLVLTNWADSYSPMNSFDGLLMKSPERGKINHN